MIALKGWPVVGYVPQMLKAMSKTGYNAFYHKWQQKLGPIYKIKGLGRLRCHVFHTLAGTHAQWNPSIISRYPWDSLKCPD